MYYDVNNKVGTILNAEILSPMLNKRQSRGRRQRGEDQGGIRSGNSATTASWPAE